MKKAFERWSRVIDRATSRKVPIVIRNLPGSTELETKLLLYGINSYDGDEQLTEFSRTTFGITEDDTKFALPDHYWSLPEFSDERRRIDCAFELHEDNFKTTHLSDDETLEYLRTLGFEFSDDRGHPLRCIQFLKRQAEAAGRGIMGRLPDIQQAQAQRWAESLQAQAEAWRMKKRGVRP